MKKNRKLLAMLLALCMLLALLVGCNGTTDDHEDRASSPGLSADAQQGDIGAVKSDTYLRDAVIITSSSDGGTFDPFPRATWGSIEMGIFQKLANVDSEGNIRLCLLKSIEKIDALTYEMTLWDFIYDTDGNQITSEDVKWSIETYVEAGNKGAVNRLDYIEVVDETTFIWHCSSEFGLGEMGKHLGNPSILSQKTYEEHGNDMTTTPVATGPYMIVDYVQGASFTLEADEDFWMKNITDEAWLAENDFAMNFQNVKTIQFQIIQDAGSRAIALEMGTVDAADSLSVADVNNFIQNPELGVSAVTLPVRPPIAFYFNANEVSPCSDVNLRQAICYAINNAEFAAGLGVPAYEVFGLSPNMYDAPENWMTGEDRDYYTYNLEKAKELVEASSYNSETLTIMYTSTTAYDAATIMFRSAMKEIGVTVELFPVEQSVLEEMEFAWDKWDIRFDTMGGGNYLNAVLKRFWSDEKVDTLHGTHIFGVEDAKLDQLFLDLQNEANDSTISAWDSYFTDEMCYGYAICGYFDLTAARSDVNVILTTGSQNKLCPGAFTFTD